MSSHLERPLQISKSAIIKNTSKSSLGIIKEENEFSANGETPARPTEDGLLSTRSRKRAYPNGFAAMAA